MNGKRFSKEFKAKVALEALKSQRTGIELAKEFGDHLMVSVKTGRTFPDRPIVL
jgi:hypothetical protein